MTSGTPILYTWQSGKQTVSAPGVFLEMAGSTYAKVRFTRGGTSVIQKVPYAKLIKLTKESL